MNIEYYRQIYHEFLSFENYGYPCSIPPIDIEPGLDLLILELPPGICP